jgi:Na+-transporting methylmalonyl-CoA/oxaloacetate decarboxylase gamma subunit
VVLRAGALFPSFFLVILIGAFFVFTGAFFFAVAIAVISAVVNKFIQIEK